VPLRVSPRRLQAIGLVLLTAVSAAVVVLPVFLLRPFSPQTARGVEVAYRLRQMAPLTTLMTALAVAWLAVSLFRRPTRWLGRTSLVPVLAVAIGAAWLARQNHFEWMFGPLPHPEYARAGEAAEFVDDADMVIAVAVNGDAVAYPVRQMAYHHLVNDQVGGVPVVSTY
jgi:Protein of unknown function (DUF3179)